MLRCRNVYLDTLELRSKAIPWAEDLARRTGLAVRIGVEFFDDVVIIHHEPRPDGSRQMPEVGIMIPAHATALGKAMLAFLPAHTESLLARGPLRSMTGETVTDPDELDKALSEVLATGYAVEDDEAVLGESSIAVPVADRDGEAVAAIAVVMPASDQPAPEAVLTLLRETARNVSRELGAPGWPPVLARLDRPDEA